MPHDDHHNDGGFASDTARLLSRRAVLGAAAAGGGATLWWMLSGQAQATVAGIGPDGLQCVLPPAETAGPFPADGTNTRAGQTVNVLTETGVERSDLRQSFAGFDGTADGVALTLEILLADVDRNCAPLEGLALYLWSCDAPGRYSLYELPDSNYLRGLQVSDAAGLIRFTTIVPGCYPGRWPHFHFEVFAGRAAAINGDAAVLTAQLALPGPEMTALYASDTRYGDSAKHLAGLSLESDGIFRDNSAEERAGQTLMLTRDAGGFMGRVTVGLRR